MRVDRGYFKYTIYFLGDAQVGKTSLIRQWANFPISHDYNSTIGYFEAVIKSPGVRFVLREIGGNEESKQQMSDSIGTSLPDAICFVWNPLNEASHHDLDIWLNSFLNHFSDRQKILEKPLLLISDSKNEGALKTILSNQENFAKKSAEKIGFKTENIFFCKITYGNLDGISELKNLALEKIHTRNPENYVENQVIISFPEKNGRHKEIFEIPYPADDSKHTRLTRFSFLKKILDTFPEKVDLDKKILWILLNLISIEKPECYTYQYLEKAIRTENTKIPFNKEDIKSKIRERTKELAQKLINVTQKSEFQGIINLLKLISELEEKVFGNKFVPRFTEEARERVRFKHQMSIKLIYQIAWRIYEMLINNHEEVISIQRSDIVDLLLKPEENGFLLDERAEDILSNIFKEKTKTLSKH